MKEKGIDNTMAGIEDIGGGVGIVVTRRNDSESGETTIRTMAR